MNGEYVRRVDTLEQYKHGCEDCIHASVYEELKKKNSTTIGIRSYNGLMCKFDTCPYADILDKYKSYVYYVAEGGVEAFNKFFKERGK